MTSAVILAQSASANTTVNYKNRLINGDFEIWQRGTAQAFITAGVYLADRWTCIGFQQARHQRVTVSSPVVGMTARFAMRVSSSPNSDNGSGGTRMDLGQKIENLNSYDLAGQVVTYSFWIRFSAATITSIANSTESAYGTFNTYLTASTTNTDAATSTDSIASTFALNVIAQGNLPTTWTKITRTGTVPVGANNVGLRLQFGSLGSTTNAGDNWYEVTELQVELGSAATAFDHRPYPVELALAQRYFARVNAPGIEFYPCMMTGGYIFPSNWYKWITSKLPVTMRTSPAVTFYPNPGSTAEPGRARYFTGNASGAGNNYTVYGTDSSVDYVKFAVYNEHNAITCYGAGAWYDANAEL